MLENMNNRLSKLILFVFAAAAMPLAALGFSVDSDADSLADPGKYSNEWRPSGPPGGDVRSLVVDPSNPDRFYFGTLDGQVYTSADAGKTWEYLYNFNRPRLFVDHIIVDPRDSRTLYVATHRHNDAGGFFKSTDGGRRWRESPELKNEAVRRIHPFFGVGQRAEPSIALLSSSAAGHPEERERCERGMCKLSGASHSG